MDLKDDKNQTTKERVSETFKKNHKIYTKAL